MRRVKQFFVSVLVTAVIMSGLATNVLAKVSDEQYVSADWIFDRNYIKSGSIEMGDMVIQDLSGNENHLRMNTYRDGKVSQDNSNINWGDFLEFSDNSMDKTSASIRFKGNNETGTGADFLTVDNAKINKETFSDGYTLEFMYYFPEDWTPAYKWSSLLARQVKSTDNVTSMDEAELGSMSVAISSVKEIQYLTAPEKDNHQMQSAAWSVSMDKGGVWYHIAVVSDGDAIKTYVNGAESFRDYINSEMDGIFADPEDGRFRIGSSWWMENDQTLDKFISGNLQRVRISHKDLDKSEWLIQNPESYMGEYGSNESLTLKDPANYNFVIIPDTQNQIKFKPEVIDTAVKELIKDKDRLNVAGVIHVGDVVEDYNSDEQYRTARDVFYQLPDAGVKMLIQQGNHDGWHQGTANYYNSFSNNSKDFRTKTESYLNMSSPSGDSSYMIVEAGSYRYLVISLSSKGRSTDFHENDVPWVKQVLETYKNLPTIVTTHDFQNTSDTQPNQIKLSRVGEKVWEIVKGYNQVFMLVGGHSHGSGYEVLNNTYGNEVISVLAVYQFAYNGGNGFFKFAEFSEKENTIHLQTYSPYSNSIPKSEKTFFDVNLMLGEGNDDIIPFNFSQRFSGMEKVSPSTATSGKWMSGEYHVHTSQSNDSRIEDARAVTKLKDILDVSFQSEGFKDKYDTQNIISEPLDFIFLTDHLRRSVSDADGNRTAETPRYVAIAQQVRKVQELRSLGLYHDAITYYGFEWDMPGLDHASVGLVDTESSETPIQGIREFEWLFADQNADADSLYVNNGEAEKALFGERQATTSGGRKDINVTYNGVQWLKDNYPESYVLFNHPSRHDDRTLEDTMKAIRNVNDISPTIAFGFEGLPGNQLSPDGHRSEMTQIFGGADRILAEIGGGWDSLLGEGRKYYTYANSDYHFKIDQYNNSSGYYPGEYSKNYTFVEPGEDGIFDYKDVLNGMRSGNSFALYGELIDSLEFSANSKTDQAVMGSELSAYDDEKVMLTIRFKSPDENNYAAFGNHQSDVTNDVTVDHIDLIAGEVTGKLDASEYGRTTNDTTRIIKRFEKSEWGKPDAEGYYTVHYEVSDTKDMYYRLRGSNVPVNTPGYTDAEGNPLPDQAYNSSEYPEFEDRINKINDRNYRSLWFYSNPVFVSRVEAPLTHEVIFEDGFGQEIERVSVVSGELLIQPAEPQKEGYSFKGWTIKGQENVYDYTQPVTTNLVLIATWETPMNTIEIEGWRDVISVGESMTLTPNIASTQDNWKWDPEYFAVTFNSPATFTGLKEGTTEISFIVDGAVVVRKSITIKAKDSSNNQQSEDKEDDKASLPHAGVGQINYWILILVGGLFIGFASFIKKKLHRV